MSIAVASFLPTPVNSGTTPGTSVPTTFSGWDTNGGFTGPGTGNFAICLIMVMASAQTITQTAGTGTWTIIQNTSNTATDGFTSAIAYRIIGASDTAPTFGWGTSAASNYYMYCVYSTGSAEETDSGAQTGAIISIGAQAAVKVATTASTTPGLNSVTPLHASDIIVVLNAARRQTSGATTLSMSSAPASLVGSISPGGYAGATGQFVNAISLYMSFTGNLTTISPTETYSEAVANNGHVFMLSETFPGTDSGTGVETQSVHSTTPFSTDSGTGVDKGVLFKTSSDSGTGVDTWKVAGRPQVWETATGSDDFGQDAYGTGTANDSGVYGAGLYANYFYLQLTLPDAGTGVDSSYIVSETIFSTDSGTGFENTNYRIPISSTDLGTGTEGANYVISIFSTGDTAAGVDVGTVQVGTVYVSSSDTGSGADNTNYSIQISVTGESGSGSDTGLLNAILAGSDSGSGVENWSIYVYSSDFGTGQDSSPNDTDYIYAVDLGTGVENWSIYVASADVSTGAESYGVEIDTVFGVDAGTGVEGPVVIKINSADSGAGADTNTSEVDTVFGVDVGTGVDSGLPNSSLAGGDSGSGVENTVYKLQINSTGDSASGVETYGPEVDTEFAVEVGTGTEGSVLIKVNSADFGTGTEANTPEVDSIFGSDAGTGAESTFIFATLPAVSDVGSGVDLALSVQDSTADTDVGSGVESGVSSTSLSGTEGGSGSESTVYTITINNPDSGAGVDNGSLVNTGSNISSNDASSGVDAGYVVSATASDVDAGSGIDTQTVVVIVADVDAGTGVDAGYVPSETLYASDSGTGVSTVPALIVSLADTETGTGADTSNLADALTDSGTGVDSASTTATLQDIEEATGAEGWAVYLYGSDTGSGAETTSPVSAYVSITDIGTGADVSLSVPATLSAAEVGFGDILEVVLVGVNDAVGMP